jgi:hypothetical protein
MLEQDGYIAVFSSRREGSVSAILGKKRAVILYVGLHAAYRISEIVSLFSNAHFVFLSFIFIFSSLTEIKVNLYKKLQKATFWSLHSSWV